MDSTEPPPACAPERQLHTGGVAYCLAKCLASLDAMDEGMAAIHVSMALDILRREHSLEA